APGPPAFEAADISRGGAPHAAAPECGFAITTDLRLGGDLQGSVRDCLARAGAVGRRPSTAASPYAGIQERSGRSRPNLPATFASSLTSEFVLIGAPGRARRIEPERSRSTRSA